MFTYYYRLHDRYRRPLASLALLTDPRPEWRPDHYQQALWDCQVRLDFPVVKLVDYRARPDLEQELNPFAVLTLSHLKAQDTARDPAQRYVWKLRLIKSLYQRGYDRADILELFRFIDWLLELPEGLEKQLWTELHTFEEHTAMPYVTSVERLGIQKGLQQGLQQEAAALLRRLLTRRFGALPEWVEARLRAAPTATLESWAERLFDAASLEAVFGDEPQAS